MNRRYILILITLAITLSIVATSALITNHGYAQNERVLYQLRVTGSLRGTVTDQTGAAIPGVTVTLVSDRLRREAITDESGKYAFQRVPTGSYRLVFHVSGFATEKRDVTVSVGQMAQSDVQLQRGALPSPSTAPSPSATLVPSPTLTPATPSPSPDTSPAVSPSPAASPSTTPILGDPLIEDEVRKLLDRAIAFNPPNEMRQGTAERMAARVAFNEIPMEVLTRGLPGRGQPQVESIKVSSVMKVVLIGDRETFAIENLNNEEQVVAGKQFSQWEWSVTPLVSGDQELFLRASATISTPHRGDKIVDIPVLQKTIRVRVDPFYVMRRFIANNWQWLWSVVLAPIAVGAWRLKKGKKTQRAGFR